MKKNFTLLLLTLTAAVIAAVFYASIAHGKVELRPSLSGKNSTLYCLAIRIQLEMAREIITDQTNATAAVTTGRIFI